MTVKHSVYLQIVAATLLLGFSLAIAEDNSTAPQPASPISLTGLISAAPAPDNKTASQSGEDNSSVSEQSTETLNNLPRSENVVSPDKHDSLRHRR